VRLLVVLCIACGAEAEPTDNEPLPVEVWALKHTGLNPTHREYKATVETYWRVAPEDNPYRESSARDV
jgi:hypothetical protein